MAPSILHTLSLLLPLVPNVASQSASSGSVTGTSPSPGPSNGGAPGPVDFTGPPYFPTAAFTKFYKGYGPSQTTLEVQPKFTDVDGTKFPLNLTDPWEIPTENRDDPVVLPPSKAKPHKDLSHIPPDQLEALSTPESQAVLNQTIANITAILKGNSSDDCQKCVDSLSVAKAALNQYPWEGAKGLTTLCKALDLDPNCDLTYSMTGNMAPVFIQVVANANLRGSDGLYICNTNFKVCDIPPPVDLDLDSWFKKPKPANADVAPKPSGKRSKVLHLSDFHLDPRYSIGSEANCSNALCCRANNPNTDVPNNTTLVPAPRFGAFACDAPYSLVGSALDAIPVLTGTEDEGFAFTLFTGDLMAHDPDYEVNRRYLEYEETSVFRMLKAHLNSGPIFSSLGNHDTIPGDSASPLNLGPKYLGKQYSWHYEHLTELWKGFDWIDEKAAKYAALHYAAYSVTTKTGLRVISLNTDMWYHNNPFTYINSDNPDNSGMLRFLTDELQDAEDNGERAWIIGHVPPGWSGTNSLPNPSNLFYSIVDRFSPATIAACMWGHVHEDVFSIYYKNNGTNVSADNAVAIAWQGPSLTPNKFLNSGFRMYEVDSETFDVLDAHTFYSNVSEYSDLDHQVEVGPSWHYEYSSREAYGKNIEWGKNDPLNSTWWHKVTEEMERDPSLVTLENKFQGKSSIQSPNCTSTECVASRICYARSGSFNTANKCPFGSKYESVQGGLGSV